MAIEYIRVLPEKNDQESMQKLALVLVKIAKRLQNEKEDTEE